ncbi:P-loop containing nucleoside triphosphate hydrolase protein [Irpex rosettiformis]|uniref:P-loop containing nucleoside triphosphate hydrolase protein n=1 Tax=Irpex rosettiformis TaxID=378272 RepID=A0ACB8UB83_9APHY|nr:P-loop containing nucleoside triphosphate hydrolase protein [Irpex rosettiformis]
MLSHLHGLNEAQSRAVQHPPNIPLQILAVSVHGVQPASICAVTFTNKAASEMGERLKKMLGKEMVSQIKMGTFHALCARYLRRYATLVGVEGNFTVCDADESKRIIARCLKLYKNVLSRRDLTLKESTVQSRISQAKAKGLSSKDLMDACFGSSSKSGSGKGKARQIETILEDSEVDDTMFDQDNTTQVIDKIVAKIYARYQETLRENNSLDFDDLLVYGVTLFREHKKVANWCYHILVDEFQDTNVMQYDLMRYIASSNRCLTIVGDPDQSIYGWRAAEVENLAKMQRDFAGTHQIFLEQNYRSTGSILAASIEIISQGLVTQPLSPDKSRIQKTLHTSHDVGPKPTLRLFSTAELEATSTAVEIKRVIASTGGMLGYNDFSVLLRYNALSRVFESALQKEGIPCRVLGGHRFFERLEVKDLLAYLQILDNPRSIGEKASVLPGSFDGLRLTSVEKSVKEILATAERLKLTPLEVVERIHDGKISDIKPPLKRKTAQFVTAIRTLRKLMSDCETPATLIRKSLSLIEYEEYLKKTQQDWESRWENVQELINFASEMEGDLEAYVANAAASGLETQEDADWSDVVEDEYEEEELDDLGFAEVKPPGAIADAEPYRHRSGRRIEGGRKEERCTSCPDICAMPILTLLQKVTLATCHSAKGLEWPVVFVPAVIERMLVENGVFPSSRAEDIEEERMRNGAPMTPEQSDFVTCLMRPGQLQSFSPDQPVIDLASRSLFSTILGRPLPDEREVSKRLHDLRNTGKPFDWPPLFSPMMQDSPYGQAALQSHSRPPNVILNNRIQSPAVPAKSIVSSKSTSINESTEPAPMSPSRKVPNRMSAIPEVKQSVKTTAFSSRNPNQNDPNGVNKKKQRLPESGALTNWLQSKPKSATAEAKEFLALPKKPTSIPSSVKSQGLQRPHPPTKVPTRPVSERALAAAPDRVIIAASTGPVAQQTTPHASKQANGKRRLGMSRAVVGYPNKKFKSPTS